MERAKLLRTLLRYLMTCSISVQSISFGQPPSVCRTPLLTRTTGFVFTCKLMLMYLSSCAYLTLHNSLARRLNNICHMEELRTEQRGWGQHLVF